MKGLLYKDLCTMTARFRNNFILLFVLYLGMAVLLDMSFMLYALVFVLGLYVQTSLSFDEQSRWDLYGRTLPVHPAALVGCKYILSAGAILAGCLIAFLAFVLNPSETKGSPEEVLLGLLVAACLTGFYFSLSMPLSYKFGSDRARTVVIIAVFLLVGGLAAAVYALPVNVLENLGDFFGLRGPMGVAARELTAGLAPGEEVWYGDLTVALQEGGRIQWAILAMLLVSMVLFLASWAVSTAIYRKKEF
ncbi:ABC-2 transporter permease [uncultured Gemmiger sp.]|uniref:ABC-2 transporter permease n=1 Tax=uncultured Gemmiger sp. TaxID=1623490 RepID=UPI0025FB1D95|nr:ABC-2 transporter permease [uncultured Gemmiger sp.]